MTGALVLAAPSPAIAHDKNVVGPYACGPLGIEACGHAGIRNNHLLVQSCDYVADGKGLVAEFRLRDGHTGTVTDLNGSAPGCQNETVGSVANPVVWIRPCSSDGNVRICWRFGEPV